MPNYRWKYEACWYINLVIKYSNTPSVQNKIDDISHIAKVCMSQVNHTLLGQKHLLIVTRVLSSNIPVKHIDCGNTTNWIKIWKFRIDLASVCWNNKVNRIEYTYLDHNNAKVLWYLDLPVFDEYGYKLIAQWFNSYWMPIIIFKNKSDHIVDKCIPILYKLQNLDKKQLEKMEANKYFNAVYWQKEGFPWWWNLDLIRWIWYSGYQQLYDRTNWILLAKYCYKF